MYNIKPKYNIKQKQLIVKIGVKAYTSTFAKILAYVSSNSM